MSKDGRTHIFNAGVNCINNQAIIENLLDMWLSQKQLEMIQTDWKVFYNDPLKYKGTVVIDMIKLALQEVK